MIVNPKPPSTVVLMDDISRVYLTKRPITKKFLSGFYVFPGGAVDKDDYAQDSMYIKNEKKIKAVNQANYIAAARDNYLRKLAFCFVH